MMTNRAQQLIRMSPVVCAVAAGSVTGGPYAKLISAEGRSEIISYSLNACIQLVPGLVRVHKAYLVNPDYVQQWVFGRVVARKLQPSYALLRSGERIPIANGRKVDLFRKYATQQ